MSADNWAKCPRCITKAEKEQEKIKKRVVNSYGKVAPDKYLELVEQSNATIKIAESLREDYDIGVTEDGEFFVRYGCSCDCGYKFKYSYDEQIKEKGD